MSLYSVPPLIASLLVLFVAIFVFLKSSKSLINITFSLLCLFVFMWLFGYAMMYSTTSEAFALWSARFVYIGVVCVPTFFYHFCVSFVGKQEERKKIIAFVESSVGKPG